MTTTQLDVQGMTCGNCVRHVETALKGVPNVEGVEVSLSQKQATVRHADGVDVQTLVSAVEEEGYSARPATGVESIDGGACACCSTESSSHCHVPGGN
jgi:copper chaperone CopZ